ncbi:hypothetical protein ACLBYG_22405 [Methylobacterium sp. D53M]
MSSVKILQAGDGELGAAAVAAPAASAGAASAPAAAPVAHAPARPSEILSRSGAGKTAVIRLASGRQVTVQRLSALQRMMAAKAIGSELVTNALYANYALVACSVIAIDDVPVGMPTSNGTIEFTIQRLGDDFDDLTELMKEAFSVEEADPFDKATVKN